MIDTNNPIGQYLTTFAPWINFWPNMALQAGIVGLPNVGKSTLFNAVSNSAKAQASNYRFCTIEPNVGLVDVPDMPKWSSWTIRSKRKSRKWKIPPTAHCSWTNTAWRNRRWTGSSHQLINYLTSTLISRQAFRKCEPGQYTEDGKRHRRQVWSTPILKKGSSRQKWSLMMILFATARNQQHVITEGFASKERNTWCRTEM